MKAKSRASSAVITNAAASATKTRAKTRSAGFLLAARRACSADGVTIASGVAIGGHVTIGRNANIGLNASVHQRRVVGAFAMVGMGSVVTKDVQPFVKAFGNPCAARGVNSVGLERAGLDAAEVDRILEQFTATGRTDVAGLPAPFDADLVSFGEVAAR